MGKTSIRRTYMGQGFSKDYNVTLGADFAVKRLSNNNILQIWDLAGQTVYKKVRSGYYKGAQGAIIVFDITRPATFKNLVKWIDEMLNVTNKIIPLILVGNKGDLRGNNSKYVSVKDAENYAIQLSNWSGFTVPYIESSALTGQNITNIFENLLEEIYLLMSTQKGN